MTRRAKRYLRLWADLLRVSWVAQPRLTVATIAVLTLSVVITAAVALALRAAVNAIVAREPVAAITAAVVAAVAYGGLYVLQDATATLRNAVTNRVARLEIEPLVHGDIAALPGIDHLERTDYLDELKVVRDGTGQLVGSMWRAALTVASALKLGIAVLLLGSVSPLLVPLLVLAAIPIWCQNRGQRLVKAAELAAARHSRLEQALAELAMDADAGREIRVAGAGAALNALRDAAWQDAAGVRSRARWLAAVLRFAGWAVFLAGFVAGIVLVTFRVVHGEGSVGDVVLCVTVAVTLSQTVQVAVNSTTAASGVGVVAEPFLRLREHSAQARDRRYDGAMPQRLRSGIRLEGVGFRYPGTEKDALADVTLTLPAGSVVAVVGEHGSGKSTLVKLLAQLYQPDTGRILVDDTDLRDLDPVEWRAATSAAFQDFGRFHLTVAESVGIGDLTAIDDERRVRAALTAADADTLVGELPDGVHALLGKDVGGVDLSEGQWQRIALARASMRSAQLLFLLDEPTASLDAFTERVIFERYMAAARRISADDGGVTVVVSHRFSTVADADLILVLDQGRLAETGDHRQLLARGGRYATLYQMQADAYRDERLG